MATRVKIKTDTDSYIHFDTNSNDYTLCGPETAGDESIGIYPSKMVKGKVNCPHCIQIVEFCHSIKRNEWE